MVINDNRSDLDQLRSEYPLWHFGSIWVASNSGPDARVLWARRKHRTQPPVIYAADAATLAGKIRAVS